MTRKHDALFNDVLSDLDAPAEEAGRAGARFLRRSTTIGDRLSGELEEKTLRWVDPARCRMWDRHNRDYALLNEDNCHDLIDGIRSQGRQEFAAIVRVCDDQNFDYEVICGARRHFAVTWLRANNYTQFKYLVDVRDIGDEEAFRLGDIENRDREDISDYERAIDYADAVERYYGGKQKAMADRLEVSQPWLSRYLQLAKLPDAIVQAFPSVRDVKERNARELKPLLGEPGVAKIVMEEARSIGRQQAAARDGRGPFVDSQTVMRRLGSVARPKTPKRDTGAMTFRRGPEDREISVRKRGKKIQIEFDASMTQGSLKGALDAFVKAHFK